MMDSVERIWRRAMYLVGRGRITAGKTTGPVQKYQVQVNDMDIRDDVPRLAEFGFTSRPPNGSDVAMICVEGNPRKSVIVGTNHQPSLPQGLLAGETVVFNLWGMKIRMTQAGIFIDCGGQPLTINGSVVVTGDVVASGISLVTHHHTGVTPGGSNTGGPV